MDAIFGMSQRLATACTPRSAAVLDRAGPSLKTKSGHKVLWGIEIHRLPRPGQGKWRLAPEHVACGHADVLQFPEVDFRLPAFHVSVGRSK